MSVFAAGSRPRLPSGRTRVPAVSRTGRGGGRWRRGCPRRGRGRSAGTRARPCRRRPGCGPPGRPGPRRAAGPGHQVPVGPGSGERDRLDIPDRLPVVPVPVGDPEHVPRGDGLLDGQRDRGGGRRAPPPRGPVPGGSFPSAGAWPTGSGTPALRRSPRAGPADQPDAVHQLTCLGRLRGRGGGQHLPQRAAGGRRERRVLLPGQRYRDRDHLGRGEVQRRQGQRLVEHSTFRQVPEHASGPEESDRKPAGTSRGRSGSKLPAGQLDAPSVVTAYKNLKYVERDFRHIKADDLDLRPVYHHLEERVRAHVLICMLGCYLTWHLRRAWAPLTFTDENPPAPDDPVAPAQTLHHTPRPRPPASTTRPAAPTAASAASWPTSPPSPATRSASPARPPPCQCSPNRPATSAKRSTSSACPSRSP